MVGGVNETVVASDYRVSGGGLLDIRGGGSGPLENLAEILRGVWTNMLRMTLHRHCEECNNEAISKLTLSLQ